MIKSVQLYLAVLVSLLCGPLLAVEEIATGKFVVSFQADADQAAWVARAMELNVYNDLSGYAKIIAVPKQAESEQRCAAATIQRPVDCLLSLYRAQDVDALMLGTVSQEKLDLVVYNVQNGALVTADRVRLGNHANLLSLRTAAFDALKPFLAKGGILDRRAFASADTNNDAAAAGVSADEAGWAITLLGGLLWGAFSLLVLKIIHPQIQLERVEQKNMGPLILAHAIMTLCKSILMVTVILPFLFAIYVLLGHIGLSPALMWMLVMPLAAFAWLGFWGVILEGLAMNLDGKLSAVKKQDNADWNQKLLHYFVSYGKRNGSPIIEEGFRQPVFLLGAHGGIQAYGGPFSKPRISVSQRLVQLALSENDHGVARKQRPDSLQSKLSLYSPPLFAHLVASKKKRRYKKISQCLSRHQQEQTYDLNGKTKQLRLGQERVMKGMVLPRLLGKENAPSLMSDNLDDMAIVDELMAEDTVHADPFDEDAEIDDSSLQDKDFLFGGLLLAFGSLVRQEYLFNTLYLSFCHKRITAGQQRVSPMTKWHSIIADSYVALQSGLNHVLQFHYFMTTKDSDVLTTKASPDELLLSQAVILSRTAKALRDQAKPNQQPHHVRVVWLSRFAEHAIKHRSHPTLVPITLWSLGLACVLVTAMAVFQAIQYRPTYQNIIALEQEKISAALEAKKEQEAEQP